MAATRGRIHRIDVHRPRGSANLLPRLPHQDAIAVALLAADGHMTWPEINAALDAKVKLATAAEINRQRRQHDLMPPSRQHDEDAWAACRTWEEAKWTAEIEIWARYHAKCDAMFNNAPDASGAAARAHEELLNREQVLDVFRMARDDELAALTQRLGPQPAKPISTRPMPIQIAMLRFRLTAEETDAIDKLERTGFTESVEMTEIIGDLAREIIDTIADVA